MTETMTPDEFLAQYGSPSKFHNVKTPVDGYTFGSKSEARRYGELKRLVAYGKISGLRVHPRYMLQEAFKDRSGKTHRAITYEADFEYRENGGVTVEDVKGARTAVFNLKEKLFIHKYPELDFRVVEA